MWQEIAVFIIGIAVLGYIGYKIYRTLSEPKSNDPCSGCSGCTLKKEIKAHKPTYQCNDK